MTEQNCPNCDYDLSGSMFIESIVAAERERCAKLASDISKHYGVPGIGLAIADAIHAPSNQSESPNKKPVVRSRAAG
jgi:hypothetical protein